MKFLKGIFSIDIECDRCGSNNVDTFIDFDNREVHFFCNDCGEDDVIYYTESGDLEDWMVSNLKK